MTMTHVLYNVIRKKNTTIHLLYVYIYVEEKNQQRSQCYTLEIVLSKHQIDLDIIYRCNYNHMKVTYKLYNFKRISKAT